MTTTPPVYQSVVSVRSRRLRTIGLLLLVAVVGMTLYGVLIMMPKLSRSIAREGQIAGISALHASGVKAAALTPKQLRARKTAAVLVLFIYGYWSVSGALVLTLLLVAYLDLREVNRNALLLRMSLVQEATRSLSKGAGKHDV